MNESRIAKYFNGFGVSVMFLDDSHARVEFMNEVECLMAINLFRNNISSLGHSCWKYLNVGEWVEMKPYLEFTFQRKVFARFWTTADFISNYCYSHSRRKKYFSAKFQFVKNLENETNFSDLNEKFQKLSIRQFDK